MKNKIRYIASFAFAFIFMIFSVSVVQAKEKDDYEYRDRGGKEPLVYLFANDYAIKKWNLNGIVLECKKS